MVRLITLIETSSEPIGLIHGMTPGSKEEWRTAQALDKRGIAYDYQVSIRGGRGVRGGQVVDFVLYNPWEQPLQVFGEYFHPGELNGAERLKLSIIEQTFGRPAWILWASQLTTQSAADAAIQSLL